MKKIALLLFFAVLANVQFVKGQDLESQELLKLRNQDFIPIGESNGHVFYYSWMRFKADLKITVYKYKEENLELVDTKEIFVKDIKPKVFNDHCKINAYFKNNKFYFFYSLLHSGDFHVGLMTVDESLVNTQDLQLGVIVETGYELLGNYFVSLSPDNKTAIVALKNFCERKKAIGTNTTTNFENTELVYVDLINNKINYSKRLPIDMQEARLSTSQYKTDNEGNLTFIASLSDRKGGNVVHAVGIGMLNKNDEKIKITEIDVTGSSSISSDLTQTKGGDLIYVGTLSNKILFKILPMNKSKKWFEASFPNKTIKMEGFDSDVLYKVTESDNGYFLTFYHRKYSNYIRYSVAMINKTGELKWHKELPYVIPIHYNVNGSLGTNAVSYNSKNYVFFGENKSYELTSKIEKMIASYSLNGEYDFKKTNTVMISIDENGTIQKKIINDNEVFVADPSYKDFVSEKGVLFMSLDGKKSYKLKKIVLK